MQVLLRQSSLDMSMFRKSDDLSHACYNLPVVDSGQVQTISLAVAGLRQGNLTLISPLKVK